MLMTMEEACKKTNEIFPNPERLDKIQDSMNNLESIVRERNRAYHLLETGETGERPGKLVYNCLGIKDLRHLYSNILENIYLELKKFASIKLQKVTIDVESKIIFFYLFVGLRFYYRMRQHCIPKFVNTRWHKTHMFGYGGYATHKFLRLYREQLWNKKRRLRMFVAIVFSFDARNMISLNLFLLNKKFIFSDVTKIMSQC